MNSEHYKSRERLTGLLRKVDLVFGKVAYGGIGCKVSEALSELTAAQGFVLTKLIAYGVWGSWSLKWVEHFTCFCIVFPVCCLDRVLKLYQLKFKCIKMPSYRRKKLSVKTELSLWVFGKWFNEGLCIAIIRLIFCPLNTVHFSGLGFFIGYQFSFVSTFIGSAGLKILWAGHTYLNFIGEPTCASRPPKLHISNSFMTQCFVHIVIPSALGTSRISRTGIVFWE